jgi:hypothetical protein
VAGNAMWRAQRIVTMDRLAPPKPPGTWSSPQPLTASN